MDEENTFEGSYEKQFEKELKHAKRLLHDGLAGAIKPMFNDIARQAAAVKLPDDPIERMKSKAIRESMKEALSHYVVAFKFLGINIADSIPDTKVPEMLANYAKENLNNN